MSSGIGSTSSLARVGYIAPDDEVIHPSNLCSKENSFSPIWSLPSELLELVFIHAARDYYESSDSHLISEVPDWVSVSYVCRHWRDVALNSSTLWTYHFNLSLRWTEELMRRSRRAPLKITCIDPDRTISWWSGLLDNVLNHSERIQELCWRISSLCIPDELFLRAPRLETLMIDASEPFNGRLVITDAGKPVLRTIELCNCSLQWHLLNLSKLESLSMCHDSPPDQFDLVEFLTSLCTMQNLTVLYLNNVIPSDVMSSGDFGVCLKINFPRLALLGVNAPLPAVIFLFSCVEIPLETQISLALWFEEDTPAEDYAPISSFLTQRFSARQSSSSRSIVRSLGMHIGSCTALTFSSLKYDCRSRSTYHFEGFDSTIPLEIVFRNRIEASGFGWGSTLLHPIMTDMCCSLPLANVRTLYVLGDGFPREFNFWRDVFGWLDNLRYLKMEKIYMPDLSMLSLAPPEPEEWSDEESADDQDPTLGRTLVPALEKVVLHEVHFLPDNVTEHHSGMSQKSLIETLSTRHGIRGKVVVNQCKVSEWP